MISVPQEVVRSQDKLLEVAAVLDTVTAGCLFVAFLIYLCANFGGPQGVLKRWWGIWHDPLGHMAGNFDGAIALMILAFAMAFRAAMIWKWRYFGGELDMQLLISAELLKFTAIICAIRVFARRKFNWPWMAALGIAGVAAMISVFSH